MIEEELDPTPIGELALRVMAMPKDANALGDISGGWLMTQMDTAASILASRIAKGRTTTVAVGEMSFIRPIRIGSVVCCYGKVTSVGRSSVSVRIEVWCRMPEEEVRNKVTETEFVFVAIDQERRIRRIEK